MDSKVCLGFRMWDGQVRVAQVLCTTPYRDKSPGGQVSVTKLPVWVFYF
jgi:hypothetical protein